MQVSRLQRELTRMEAERDRAREDARRYTSLLSQSHSQSQIKCMHLSHLDA